MATGRSRVFLVDDHELIRIAIRSCIEATDDLEVVGEAGTAREALLRIPSVMPDVTLLDVRLPDGNGVDVCRDIRSRHPEIKFLILTTFADDASLFNAILAGASGYLLKETRSDQLIESVRRVTRGQSLLDPVVTNGVLDRIRRLTEGTDRLEGLTDQERRILGLIGRGLTNRQIAHEIHLAEKTVKNYVSSLLAKLGMRHRVDAAIYVTKLNASPPAG